MQDRKTIIVEGKTDKDKLLPLLDEPVEIICTQGTLGLELLEDLIPLLEHRELYIWVDADEPGIQLRKQLKREFPNAIDMYTLKKYREVARTPLDFLVKKLHAAHFEIHPDYKYLLTNHNNYG